MLGNIAKKLRIMGFDTEFWLDANDEFLINKSNREQKLLITRDRGLYLKISKLSRNGLLLSDDYEVENLVFILERCDIKHINPVPNLNTRCTICNGTLKKFAKTVVSDPIPEKVYKNISLIYKCSKCSKVYWEGTHIENINKFIDKINNSLRQYR
ncbi:MAG: Mut7-C RNAse domain-containing protein [Candidatus Nitrosocosmicus sp.]|nr:Mut7-C RNAse domain-containing protein [Candidatus Nitrosocosmicus sp.]MDN5867434.1 Mut7-C RNAse domain-containing protein [Candidatus Nitrosocosmicus sp.]